MPYYLAIALKNVLRDRRRTITLGVNYFLVALLLLVVFSLTGGLKITIGSTILGSTAGHITISGETIIDGKTYQGISGFQRIDSIVKATVPTAQVYTRYTLSSAVYFKSLSKRLTFVGLDTRVDTLATAQISLYDGDWESFAGQPNAILVPKAVAEYFGLANKDELLLSTRSRFGAFNTGTLKVSGLFKTGNYFLRETVFGHFSYFQSLDLVDTTVASKMYLFFDDIKQTELARELLMEPLQKGGFVAIKPSSSNDALNAVSAASPRYKVEDSTLNQVRLTLATADEVTGVVSQAASAVNALGLFIAAIMLFIISISIFINTRMSINERMREIGTLRAIGAEKSDIVRLFVAEHVLLCLIAVAAGLAVGLVGMTLFSAFVTLPTDGVLGLVLSRGKIVLRPGIAAIFFIISILTLATAFFAWIPARYGGKISPVDALNKTT